MKPPSDPAMLLSWVNTKLRDFYSSLEELCKTEELDELKLRDKLSLIGYEYDEKLNKFV